MLRINLHLKNSSKRNRTKLQDFTNRRKESSKIMRSMKKTLHQLLNMLVWRSKWINLREFWSRLKTILQRSILFSMTLNWRNLSFVLILWAKIARCLKIFLILLWVKSSFSKENGKTKSIKCFLMILVSLFRTSQHFSLSSTSLKTKNKLLLELIKDRSRSNAEIDRKSQSMNFLSWRLANYWKFFRRKGTKLQWLHIWVIEYQNIQR